MKNKRIPLWAKALIIVGGFLILLFIAIAEGDEKTQKWQSGDFYPYSYPDM